MEYTSGWNITVYWPRLKLSFRLVPWHYTPAPVPLFVLEPSVYQNSPTFLSDWNPFFPFTFITEPDREGFIIIMSRYHFIRPHLQDGPFFHLGM
jgi:hypothetical protein